MFPPMDKKIKRSKLHQDYFKILQSQPSVVWKRFSDGLQLKMHLFLPEGHHADRDIASVVFFHGGMWRLENMTELISWALMLKDRNIACLIPEYRTRARFDVLGEDILGEANEVWNWVNRNALPLGLDPTSITLAGVDAGGLMALHASMPLVAEKKRWWLFSQDELLPHMPAAIAIFRATIDILAPEAMPLNLGYEMEKPDLFNPAMRLRRNLPPLFCAHGSLDPLQALETSEWFCDEWERFQNPVRKYVSPITDHTLMKFEVNPQIFEQIALEWEDFMIEQSIWPERAGRETALLL